MSVHPRIDTGNGKSTIFEMFSRTSFNYSRVHKRWQSFFSKILEKPSIVQKKMLPHIKGIFHKYEAKKNSKWPT